MPPLNTNTPAADRVSTHPADGSATEHPTILGLKRVTGTLFLLLLSSLSAMLLVKV